ncbi:MAG: methyltransferase domain-containing protein [Armatimonadetes bacterium]|nr:methyltransferase domain-containing protein [Armatimonadota bacterium]
MDSLTQEAIEHYLEGKEHGRLLTPHGKLEFERSKDILLRHLFQPPAKVLDLGGGTGHYSFWLANLGYEVHLVDAMESHIEVAKKLVQSYTLASISVGDARGTRFGDESFDMVLLFGPLYHLTERRDRIQALEEASRVLKPGGRIFAVGISRFASLFDGYFRGLIDDPNFQTIVDLDLVDGQHRNPTGHPDYFTTTKFHEPNELKGELQHAGFLDISLHGIEGPAWLMPNYAELAESPLNEKLMGHLREIEQQPSLLGMSAHIMAVGRKWLEPREIAQ